ncbi:unnamed protein product [Dovyalis caffra]|uniref:Transposase n=1 Tax=Dovyalis caffra TaxID=77055 RepID=A0AAV1SH21_9ROSI|nr:unnamed protein product [Dovyalis caffra]
MQAAAKYFRKGNNGEGWRAAVEAEVVEVVDGGGNNEEEKMIQGSGPEEVAAVVEEEANGVLDLNATPVVESDGAEDLGMSLVIPCARVNSDGYSNSKAKATIW